MGCSAHPYALAQVGASVFGGIGLIVGLLDASLSLAERSGSDGGQQAGNAGYRQFYSLDSDAELADQACPGLLGYCLGQSADIVRAELGPPNVSGYPQTQVVDGARYEEWRWVLPEAEGLHFSVDARDGEIESIHLRDDVFNNIRSPDFERNEAVVYVSHPMGTGTLSYFSPIKEQALAIYERTGAAPAHASSLIDEGYAFTLIDFAVPDGVSVPEAWTDIVRLRTNRADSLVGNEFGCRDDGNDLLDAWLAHTGDAVPLTDVRVFYRPDEYCPQPS